jgi:hypothetical protein
VCPDGFEIGCDNGDKVRVAFALDCCDREATSFLAPRRKKNKRGAPIRPLGVATASLPIVWGRSAKEREAGDATGLPIWTNSAVVSDARHLRAALNGNDFHPTG